MLRKFLLASLPALTLIGCLNGGSDNPAGNPDPVLETGIQDPSKTQEIRDLEKLVDITVGRKSVIMYKGPDGVNLVEEAYPPGETPLLTPDMANMTWKQIQEKLAPNKPVAAGLEDMIYAPQEGKEVPVQMKSMDGAVNQAAQEGSGVLRKAAGETWDIWFQQNYCNSGNAFSWCLLNREGNDWGQTNAKRTDLDIYLYKGGQATLSIKVGGTLTFRTTLVFDDLVHTWITKSGKDFWGLYKVQTHRYDIAWTAGTGWHWNVAAHTW